MLLIDLDICLYKGLWATSGLGFFAGLRAVDNIVTNIIERFDCDYKLFMSGSGNFRKEISPEYKANRKPESKPPYLYDTKQWFKKYWNAVESNGCEADDLIAIEHDSCSIVISSDKDFFQLGGKIYNPWKDEMYEITNPEYWFYYQLIVGDSADNVKTLYGYGPKKAEKILANKTPEEMKIAVQNLYRENYNDEWYKRYDTTARLLYLRRKEKPEYYNVF